MWRVHKVVRGIMRNNGTDGGLVPIPGDKVLGFRNETEMEAYSFDRSQEMQGNYLFNSPNAKTVTFLVQQNGTTADYERKQWTRPYLDKTVPMEVAAAREIARQVFFENDTFPFEVALQEFAHPAMQVASFEGLIAPLALLACAMFPFVIQVGEVAMEREYKLRQALTAMGLFDLSYWLSWHIYQSSFAFIGAVFIYIFGCLFQFSMFLKNDALVILLTFWMFSQAMVGLGFFTAAFLQRSSQAVSVGFAFFMLGFLTYFIVLFGFPFGVFRDIEPFSYERNITTGILTLKDSLDVLAEPIFCIIPPAQLIKAISDLGHYTRTEKDFGIRLRNAWSYCDLENSCNPSYSIGNAWISWFILYILYSTLGLYLENVLPDAMGVRKGPFYFLTASYWGFSKVEVQDEIHTIEESTDVDVIEEEALIRCRANLPMAPDSAVEIRGLRQTFKRGGRAFHAVKAPWYNVGKKQLFALLGPNGAGKTTTINMLTGFLPPSAGNALVLGHTVAHPSSMNRIKKSMGVCPQFDILWDSLTAKEHLMLFGTIKGLNADALEDEADRRIEQVRLSASSNQVAGSFSGGMKRRLSVAVALIGDPQVVYLDEPTTGMDPINRRHVWDVIEAAKQDRTIILTTHSMEEADILGDRIAIMAKGRLRCIGGAVRLKTRFGAGYRVSVSCGDPQDLQGVQCLAVKALFHEHLKVVPEEESKAYMHFNVPSSEDERLAAFFAMLDERSEDLGVVDVQVGMSSLEDVFLRIAKDAEADEARLLDAKTTVTLKTGEEVGVLLGSEETLKSPNNTMFSVVWGTDEEGRLIPVDTLERGMVNEEVSVTVPEGVSPGAQVQIEVHGHPAVATIPPDAVPGSSFTATVLIPGPLLPDNAGAGEGSTEPVSQTQVKDRVGRLEASFGAQAGALFRKNLSFQSKRWWTNGMLLLVPVAIAGAVLTLQYVIEVFFLGTPAVRCPYCGPPDAFSAEYCPGMDCVDFFFPEDDLKEYQRLFGVDVRAACNKTRWECGGNGSTSCFHREWSTGVQLAFCPFTTVPKLPNIRQTTMAGFRSKTPVLYTGANKAFSAKIADELYPDGDDVLIDQVAMVARSTTFVLWTLLMAPVIGCSTMNISMAPPTNSSMLGSIADQLGQEIPKAAEQVRMGNMNLMLDNSTQQAAICKLIQEGTGNLDPCCLDLSIAPLNFSDVNFTAIFNGNFWSANVNHTEESFEAEVLKLCDLGANGTSELWDIAKPFAEQWGVSWGSWTGPNTTMMNAECRSAASAAVVGLWREQGAVFANGTGKELMRAAMKVALNSSLVRVVMEWIDNVEPMMTCVHPSYTPQVDEIISAGGQIGEGGCMNFEEGLARIAKAVNFSYDIWPTVPEDFEKIRVKGVDYYPEGPGRWAQTCDFYTNNLEQEITDLNWESFDEVQSYINGLEIPCACRWLAVSKLVAPMMAFPTGVIAGVAVRIPETFSCTPMPTAWSTTVCIPGVSVTDTWSMPSLKFATPNWPQQSAFFETAIVPDPAHWWNKRHVISKKEWETKEGRKQEKQKQAELHNEEYESHWQYKGTASGSLAVLSANCSAFADGLCFLRKMANLSGIELECIDTRPAFVENLEGINRRMYAGTWDRFSDQDQQIEDFINGFDFTDSSELHFNVTLMFNDTTQVSSRGGPLPQLRVTAPLSDAVDAYINAIQRERGLGDGYTAGMRGLKEMPQPHRRLTLDLGGVLGAFFFTLAFGLLFPTIVVALVYEKEMHLRVMMRMMGLGSAAYWIINYAFWLLMYSMYILFMVAVASGVSLPSGYTIGLFTKTEASVHFVNFFLFANYVIALSFLWSNAVRSARAASISSTLFVISMALVAFMAWDTGGYFFAESVSDHMKTFITLFPFWGFYRGWLEYGEYAFKASRQGGMGLTWDTIINDPMCGMSTTLIVHVIEWPLLLLLAVYFDQVLDTGHGVPKHPLFFLGWKHAAVVTADAEADVTGKDTPEDVKKEAARVDLLAQRPSEEHDAVMVLGLNKVFPPYMGNPAKVAVKTLTMSVKHGECFGMLGPNGAGKTTTINMLVGFATPTQGTALIEGFSIRSDMSRIYTLMGVCPQHNVLWETLTAREHMLFYGRLKNLSGSNLKQAVSDCLRQVNLLNVMDEKSGTFSGGMKRRLSVAIAMIGNPLCCYLDEPSTGLDPASRRTLWACIKEAKKSRAVFLTTHSMEEAEGLCDRLGIFVDGALRCVGNPKELTARFGGFYIITVSSLPGTEEVVGTFVKSLASDVRVTYALAGTQKFEVPTAQLSLAKAFGSMMEAKRTLGVVDWAIANTTLEEAFIKISKGAVGT